MARCDAVRMIERTRRPRPDAVHSEGLECLELSHASRAQYHDGFAGLNVSLHARATTPCRRAIFMATWLIAVKLERAYQRNRRAALPRTACIVDLYEDVGIGAAKD
jgi:hypothetical protein